MFILLLSALNHYINSLFSATLFYSFIFIFIRYIYYYFLCFCVQLVALTVKNSHMIREMSLLDAGNTFERAG